MKMTFFFETQSHCTALVLTMKTLNSDILLPLTPQYRN